MQIYLLLRSKNFKWISRAGPLHNFLIMLSLSETLSKSLESSLTTSKLLFDMNPIIEAEKSSNFLN